MVSCGCRKYAPRPRIHPPVHTTCLGCRWHLSKLFNIEKASMSLRSLRSILTLFSHATAAPQNASWDAIDDRRAAAPSSASVGYKQPRPTCACDQTWSFSAEHLARRRSATLPELQPLASPDVRDRRTQAAFPGMPTLTKTYAASIPRKEIAIAAVTVSQLSLLTMLGAPRRVEQVAPGPQALRHKSSKSLGRPWPHGKHVLCDPDVTSSWTRRCFHQGTCT